MKEFNDKLDWFFNFVVNLLKRKDFESLDELINMANGILEEELLD